MVYDGNELILINNKHIIDEMIDYKHNMFEQTIDE